MLNDLPRVLMVVTRDIPLQAESGRERTMCFIKGALAAGGEIEVLRLHSVLERRSTGRVLSVMAKAMGGLLRGEPLPLQTLLFHSADYLTTLAEAVQRFQPETVYFDGVRSGLYALPLRRRFPQLNLVCDFDDLMSRRIEVLAEQRQPISVGYLKKFVPAWVQQRLLDGVVARAIQAYEHRALRSLENRISQVSDSVVLVSSVDAQHMREQLPDVPVEVIPPYMETQCRMQELKDIKQFIFIGADSLLQNRLTIEYLVALWQRLRPKTELHIFGKQTGNYPAVEGVIFGGFVKELSDAYAPQSILLAPSFVGGGVKTKVLEAFSYGVIPIGTETTFEGVQADCRKLTLTEQQLEDLIQHPQAWLSTINSAGAIAEQGVVKNHAGRLLGERWRNLVWPAWAGKKAADF